MNIYNVTVIPADSKGIALGYMIESLNIKGAVKEAERYGTVVKAVWNEWDEE